MSAASGCVAFLLAILLSSPESETANITAFITNSSSPSYAVEGESFSLEWTYTLDGSVGFAQFSIITSGGSELLIGKKFGPGVITVQPEYQARFRAQATNTRAELIFLAVQRSDETSYKMNISPNGSGSLGQLVDVIVNVKPTITEISGNQTVTEGENTTLTCLADGKPKANIILTRLSDNSVVNMTIKDIRRQDRGKYTCTADNGIGRPATGNFWIVVQYSVEATSFGVNSTVPVGGNQTFFCPVDGIPKPNILWFKGREVNETPIFIGEKLEVRESGCYTCVASNFLGKSVITQCLIVEDSSSTSASPTSTPKRPSQTVIGVVVGVGVFMVIMIGIVTWWFCKKKECINQTRTEELDYVEVDQKN